MTLFANIHDKIAEWIDKNYYIGRSKEEMKTLSEALLPAYHATLEEMGLNAFHLGTTDGNRIVERVMALTGFDKQIVLGYLASLENAAKQGVIDPGEWNRALDTPEKKNDFLNTVAGLAGEAASHGFNRILFTGAMVAITYLIGREIISRKL